MRHNKLLIIIITLFIASCGNELQLRRNFDEEAINANGSATSGLRITVIDVGQGDATLIWSQKEAILIDAGPEGAGKNKIIPYLKQNNLEELKAIIITHYHVDHLGGITEILLGEDGIAGTLDDIIPTEGVWDRGEENEPNENEYHIYKQITSAFRHTVHPGLVFNVGEADLEVVASNGEIFGGESIEILPFDENAASIALILNHESMRFFVGGDISGGGGDPPYQTVDVETALAEVISDIDILKVSHHGSRSSTNETFISTTKPEVAIISVGDDNRFHHPHPSVIQRLLDHDVRIYLTEAGNLSSDDEMITVGGDIEIRSEDGDYFINGDIL